MANELTVGDLFKTGWQRFLAIKISTHAIAGAAGTAGLMWASDPAFRSALSGVFHAMPHWAQAAMGVATVAYSAYKTVHKGVTVSATVQPGDTGTASISAEAESK